MPIGFAGWRVASLGRTSFETLREQPPLAQAAHFKTVLMWEMSAATVALILIVLLVEREPLGSIGVRSPSWRDLGPIAAIFIASVVGAFLSGAALLILSGYSLSPQTIPRGIPGSAFPARVRLLMFVVEPVFEETVYRGYFIERLDSLIGSTAVAVAASALCSSLMHGGWGTLALGPLPLGLSSAALYSWRRNLPACWLLHSLWMLTPALGIF